MKKISYVILFIGLIQFLSGCSQGHSSNANNAYQAQQRHAIAQSNKQKAATAPNQHQIQQSDRNKSAGSQYPARNQMMKVAYSTVGTPYKWGGNNPQQGFDCSGLMKYVYKNALGVNIPRTAAKQRDRSRTVNYAQLQPGDMLFFKTGRNSNHVGIYVGNRKFVHAASGSKNVKIASMDSSYWHKRFVKFGTFL